MANDSRRSYRLLNVVVALSLVLLGAGLLIVTLTFDESISELGKQLLEHAAGIVLVGGALGIVFEFFLRKEIFEIFNDSVVRLTNDQKSFEAIIDTKIDLIKSDLDVYARDVSNKLSLSQGSARIGLVNVHHQESNFDYSDMITNSTELTFVFNDGRTWFSQHEADIAERLADSSKKTIVILNSKSSNFLQSLGERVEQTPESLKSKIDESISKLLKLRRGGHDLRIFEHPLPTSYSLVMSEHSAILIPYLIAGKSDKIPCFFFAKGTRDGFYEALRKDVAALMYERGSQLHPQQPPLNRQSESLP